MARPHRRALAFLGSGFGRLLTTHRESARWSISLHYQIASLQGRIAVKRRDLGKYGRYDGSVGGLVTFRHKKSRAQDLVCFGAAVAG